MVEKFVYPVKRVGTPSGLPGASSVMVFGGAERAVSFVFGPRRNRTLDAERVCAVRRGAILSGGRFVVRRAPIY